MPAMTHLHARRRGLTFVDLLACIVLLSLVAAAAIPAMVRNWETSKKINCAENLRQIGVAMRQYAIDDTRAGSYPRTLYRALPEGEMTVRVATPYADTPDLGVRPGVDPFIFQGRIERATKAEAERMRPLLPYAPAENDVTAAMWHLLRVSDLGPEVFICPATRRQPMTFAGGADKSHYTNWPGTAALRDHLGYSFQNMYPSVGGIGRGFKWTDSLRSDFALVADINPGGENLLTLTAATAPGDIEGMAAFNSPNHFGDGQNVLYADGSVRFENAPLAGVAAGPGGAGDNVYTYQAGDNDPATPASERRGGGIMGSSHNGADSVLVPSAKDIGQAPAKRPTEAEITEATN